MIEQLDYLALEVKYLDDARDFYEGVLGLEPADIDEDEVRYPLPDGSSLVLRSPGRVPRGGVHTHYAFAAPEREIPRWRERAESEDLVTWTHEFGDSTAVYFYDPDGHCVELCGVADPDAEAVAGLFEIVLEVEDLESAVEFYRDLGAKPLGEGENDRLRLDAGAVDIELWLPRLGIADGQGGLHVDLAFEAMEGVEPPSEEGRVERTEVEDCVRVRDADGHYLTFL